MAQFSLVRPLVSLLIGGTFALLGGACSTADSLGDPSEPAGEHVGSADQHLTAGQCMYFDVNGTDTICHATGSTKNPYTIIKTSEQGCINGHTGHAHDYIAVGDPTCQGGGCLPTGAPCDATLPCCSGSTCEGGTCVLTCTTLTTCEAQGFTCGMLDDGCGDTLDCGSCAPGFTCESGTCELATCPCEALPGWGPPAVPVACANNTGSGGPGSIYYYLYNLSDNGVGLYVLGTGDFGAPKCGIQTPTNQAFLLNDQAQLEACAQSFLNIAQSVGVSCDQ